MNLKKTPNVFELVISYESLARTINKIQTTNNKTTEQHTQAQTPVIIATVCWWKREQGKLRLKSLNSEVPFFELSCFDLFFKRYPCQPLLLFELVRLKTMTVRLVICPFIIISQDGQLLGPPQYTCRDQCKDDLHQAKHPTKERKYPNCTCNGEEAPLPVWALAHGRMSARLTMKRVRQGHGWLQQGCLVYNCETGICGSTNCHKHSEVQTLFSYLNVPASFSTC